MSLATALKGLVRKTPADQDPRDPRRANPPLANGRRKGESDNPYLTARRTWNDHVSSVASSRQTWQMIGILSLLIALSAVGGVMYVGSQSKFIPYVIEVDKLGQVAAMGTVNPATKADPRVLNATVSMFVSSARMVTPDVALQRKAVFEVYAHLAPNDPATTKMNEWLNKTPESSPFARAANEMVSVEIRTAMAQTPDTWQVDWVETTRDRQGVMVDKPVNMRALVTVYTAEMTPSTTEQQIRDNPLGIYIRDFSWSRLQ